MKNLTLVACLLFATQLMYAQETVAASGGEALGSGGSVSYTLGQVFYTSLSDSNGTTRSEGVQQPRKKRIYIYNDVWTTSDPNGTATADDDIVIASGNAIINVNTICNTMTIKPGSGLTLDPGITLTPIRGLTLESSSTSYSSLIRNGNVSGTLNYERHVNINGSGSTGNNDLVSAPLTGQTTSAFIAANPNILSNSANTLYLFGIFDKGSGNYLTSNGTETTVLDPGVGYRAASDDNDTFTFTGTAQSDDVTVGIMNSGPAFAEWNLIGNPYPSYLNVQLFLNNAANMALLDENNVGIYGYDGTASDGWITYNLANTSADTTIAPGQGFFVAAEANGTIEFTREMREFGTEDDFIQGRNAELVYLKLQLSTDTKSYKTDFYFNANASLGLDLGYDAGIWGGSAPGFAIYSHLVEENAALAMAIQSLNSTDISDVSIPLGVNANQGEQITFSIFDATLPESVNVYLDDTVTNISTLLNNSNYVISPTTPLTGTGRFFLRISEDALSTIENTLDSLDIFVLNSSKELIVRGQLQEHMILDLYDIQGRSVLSSQLDSSSVENRINISSLSSGIYVTKVSNSTQIKIKKLIVK